MTDQTGFITDEWPDNHQPTRADAYAFYLKYADDGTGGDIIRKGAPLLSFDEWLMTPRCVAATWIAITS